MSKRFKPTIAERFIKALETTIPSIKLIDEPVDTATVCEHDRMLFRVICENHGEPYPGTGLFDLLGIATVIPLTALRSKWQGGRHVVNFMPQLSENLRAAHLPLMTDASVLARPPWGCPFLEAEFPAMIPSADGIMMMTSCKGFFAMPDQTLIGSENERVRCLTIVFVMEEKNLSAFPVVLQLDGRTIGEAINKAADLLAKQFPGESVREGVAETLRIVISHLLYVVQEEESVETVYVPSNMTKRRGRVSQATVHRAGGQPRTRAGRAVGAPKVQYVAEQGAEPSGQGERARPVEHTRRGFWRRQWVGSEAKGNRGCEVRWIEETIVNKGVKKPNVVTTHRAGDRTIRTSVQPTPRASHDEPLTQA